MFGGRFVFRCRILYTGSCQQVKGCLAVRHAHVNTQDKSRYYDVIIAGGGLVGTTLAAALGHTSTLAGKTVLLLEGGPCCSFQLQPRYSNRVVAINNSSQSLLESVGAWQHVLAARCAPVRKLQVWDACSDAAASFGRDDLARAVAHVVESDVLLAAVSRAAQLASSVTTLHEASVRSCELPRPGTDSDLVRVHTDHGSFACSLLVGADGAASRVRGAAGLQFVSRDYHQRALVATLQLSEPTENVVAWQRFLPSGPIALLPLTAQLSSLVWSTSTDEARRLLSLPPDSFVDAVNEALWKQFPRDSAVEWALRGLYRLLEGVSLAPPAVRQLQPSVACVEEGSRAAFPLGLGHAPRYVAPGIALVGDAAHRVHPLAGQGMNLGLGDVRSLARVLADAVSSGQRLGSMAGLLRYETARQRHNVPTVLAIDGLHRLYNTAATPVVVLRSLGLHLTQCLPPVKEAIMEHAAV
ncbi:ubiquinone biosynthesis monooxygenase COQ6, mitochondrial [Bacillus rossius redtenbacheri]|uniref:ubiquinone biosynthesis monooxygenase COQ6, mitochondrial n=1 Tax=Bacillus rossius redtenbacheri TaxID=93214 RepID=UPI002FDE0C49